MLRLSAAKTVDNLESDLVFQCPDGGFGLFDWLILAKRGKLSLR